MFKKILNTLGISPQQAAAQLSQYGNPADIQAAIETGDVKALSFVMKAAQTIRETNPQTYNQAALLYENMQRL